MLTACRGHLPHGRQPEREHHERPASLWDHHERRTVSGFQKATKKKAKARIALDGPSGAGKTWTGLTTAIALAGPNGRVAVIDSERGSASLYADRFDFDVLDLEDFNPRRYIRAIQDAADAGYDVLLIDSLTHAWQFVLEYVDQAKKRFGGNSYMAWSEGTPLWQALIDAILKAPMHVVVTMRSKSKFVEEQDNKGRTTYKRAGTEPVARDGVEFEFTIVGDMNLDHDLIISKTRCGDAVPVFYREPGPEFGRAVLAFLESGEDVPEPTRAERIKADPTCVVQVLREEYPEATDGMTDEDIKDRVRGQGYRTLTQIQDGASRLLTSFGTFIPNGDEATTQDIQETFDAVREETPA